MGIFDSIKNLKSSIWSGVKKGFNKFMAGFGKVFGGQLGQIVMLALTVWTAGAALLAGVGAWTGTAASAGLSGKFMAAGKAFLSTLTGIGAAPVTPTPPPGTTVADAASKVAAGAEQASQVANAAGAAGDVLAKTSQVAAGTSPGGAASLASAVAPASRAAPMINPQLQVLNATERAAMAAQQAAQSGGLLSKAARGAWNFAKTDAGGNIIGQAVQGYATAQAEEAKYERELKAERRIDKLWGNVKNSKLNDESLYETKLGGGWLDRARRVSEDLGNRDYRYPTSAGAGG